MNIKVSETKGVSVVRPQGDLTGQSEDGFLATTRRILEKEHAKIVLDLSEVPHLNSSGLGDLVRLAAQANSQGGRFVLASPQPFVMGILETTQLHRFFDVYPDVDAALKTM